MSIGSKYKQCNEPKLQGIRFPGNKWAVLAIAGSLDGARLFQEEFEAQAVTTEIKDERTIPDLADSVLKKTRSKILDSITHPSTTNEERQAHLSELNFEGIIAFYSYGPYLSTPHFYTIDLRRALSFRSQRAFETIGSGSDIAGFVLTGADLKRYLPSSAIGFAAYTIESCKRFDQSCGGPLQILMLDESSPNPPWTAPADLLSELSETAQRTADEMHQEIADRIHFNMKESSEILEKALAERGKK